jgi:hypothetical protein
MESTQVLMDEDVDKNWYNYTMEYIQPERKGWNSVICGNMDKPGGHYVNQNKPSIGDKYHMISLMCGIYKNWCDRHWEQISNY